MLSTRDPPQNKAHIQTESEGLKKNISRKRRPKESQMPHLDIWTFHPKTINFTFFSNAHGTSSRIDHILGHKSSLGKFKKIEIIPVIFSDRNAVRLDLNNRGGKKNY